MPIQVSMNPSQSKVYTFCHRTAQALLTWDAGQFDLYFQRLVWYTHTVGRAGVVARGWFLLTDNYFTANHNVLKSCAGDGLFLGNSMPIRDADSFAGCIVRRESDEIPVMSDVPQDLGARVAANRGASGIDGIISSAAGFAFGLKRAVTLLIGDVSFLHDINGLNLLRTSRSLLNLCTLHLLTAVDHQVFCYDEEEKCFELAYRLLPC